MEYERIPDHKSVRLYDRLKGIANKRVECEAPRLVTCQPAALFAGRMCAVLLALMPGGRA
jgi:hypothetical protein